MALIADYPLGQGRLLISTFRLRRTLRTHAVAAIMLRDMIAYLGRRPAADVIPVRAPVLGT